MPGGFGDTRDATADEQGLLDVVKAEVEEKLSKTFATFQALSFQSQVVAGVNYIFKVKCDNEIIHVKVAKPLPHTNKPPFLMAVSTGKDVDSPIEYFE